MKSQVVAPSEDDLGRGPGRLRGRGRYETRRPPWGREAAGAGTGRLPERAPAVRRSGAYAFGPTPAVSVPASFRGSAGSTTGRSPVLVAIDGVSTEA